MGYKKGDFSISSTFGLIEIESHKDTINAVLSTASLWEPALVVMRQSDTKIVFTVHGYSETAAMESIKKYIKSLK